MKSVPVFNPIHMLTPFISQHVEPLEWIHHSDPDKAPNLMCIYMGPKYEVPDNGNAPKLPQKRTSAGRKLRRIMVNAPAALAPDAPGSTPPMMPPPAGLPFNFPPLFHFCSPIKQILNSMRYMIPASYMTMVAPFSSTDYQDLNNGMLSILLARWSPPGRNTTPYALGPLS